MCQYCGYDICETQKCPECGWDSRVCTSDPYHGIAECPECIRRECEAEAGKELEL